MMTVMGHTLHVPIEGNEILLHQVHENFAQIFALQMIKNILTILFEQKQGLTKM